MRSSALCDAAGARGRRHRSRRARRDARRRRLRPPRQRAGAHVRIPTRAARHRHWPRSAPPPRSGRSAARDPHGLLRATSRRARGSTARCGTPNASARKRSSSAFALPSTGGAASRIFERAAVHAGDFGALRAGLHVQRRGRACVAAFAAPRAPGTFGMPSPSRARSRAQLDCAIDGAIDERADQRLEPTHRQHQRELRERRSRSAATGRACRRAAARPGGSARRKRNVSALSSAGDRPVGRDPRQDRLREHDDDQQPQRGLRRARRTASEREHRRCAGRRAPPPPSSKPSATSQRNCASHASSSVAQSSPR